MDALQADSRTADLKKSTFRDFQRLAGYFFLDDTTRQTSASVDMKNPLYWAMLVGMTILLMEQGKWWVCSPWSTCYRCLRLGSDAPVCQFTKWLLHVADSLWPDAGHLNRSLNEAISEVQLSCLGASGVTQSECIFTPVIFGCSLFFSSVKV